MDYNTDLLCKGGLTALQLLNCEISSLISSIISVLQCIVQMGLVAYYWSCLTLPITRLCFQLLRALPSFNHLDLMPSVCLRLNNFRKCQPKSEKCIKILTTFMWTAPLPPVLCRKSLTSGRQTDLCVKDEKALKVCMKTHRIPNLLESPTARCKAQARLWFHPQWMCLCLGCCCCCGVQECSSSSSLKTKRKS